MACRNPATANEFVGAKLRVVDQIGIREMKNLLIVALLVGLISPVAVVAEVKLIRKDGKWVRQAPPAKGTPAGEAALIRRKIDRGKYRSALRAAKKFLKRYQSDPLREDVLELAGDAELARGRYWQAYEWYENQLAEFPGGDRLERTLEREIQIAKAFLSGKKRIVWGVLRLDAEQEGIDILGRIAEHAPASQQAELAMLAIGEHYRNKGEWRLAAEAYEQFLTLMPKASRAAQAELSLATSLLQSYRGPLWDERPLIEAEQRFKAFAAKYPAEARKAQVEHILKGIRSARAEKQFETVRFYQRTNKPDAAGYYLRLILKEYPDTESAKRAQTELDKLTGGAGLKPVPPDSNKPAPPAGKEGKP